MKADYVLSYDVLSAAREYSLYLMARIEARPAPAERNPLNLSVVLDRSGSMQGDKLAYVKQAAQFLVQRLGADDHFSLVAYDHQVAVPIPPGPVIHKDKLNQTIRTIKTGGSTNLSGGWLQGCQLVAEFQGGKEGVISRVLRHVGIIRPSTEKAIVEASVSRAAQVNRVLLLTDGLANQGVTEPDRLAAMARQKREEGVTTTTMGVGMDFNEDLLTRMAAEGGGSFYFIDNPDQAPQIFAEELQDLLNVVGQNLAITLTLSPDVRMVTQLNDYPSERQEREIAFRLGDLFADEIKTLLLELYIPALEQLGAVEVARLRFDYDELSEERVTHQTLELPIVVNIVPDVDIDEDQQPDAEVVKTALLLRAARAREEAIHHADQGDFERATDTLSSTADAIYESNLDDDELQSEHDMLREEAVDMEMGAQRYDSRARKTSTSKIFHHSRTRRHADHTLSLHEHLKLSRKALERDGETPTVIVWKRETLDLMSVDVLRIGRDPDNDIVVPEAEVSAHHCQIVREGDDLFLVDLASTNGTFANGGRVRGRFRLSVGDVMTIGPWLFMFRQGKK